MISTTTHMVQTHAALALVVIALCVAALHPSNAHALIDLDILDDAILASGCSTAIDAHDAYFFEFDAWEGTALQFSVPTNEQNVTLLSAVSASAAVDLALLYKECVIDPTLWDESQFAVDTITDQVVDWQETGVLDTFTFVQEPIEHLLEVSKASIDASIGDPTGELAQQICTPFRPEVQLATYESLIKSNYDNSTGSDTGEDTCSLDDAGIEADWDQYVENGDMMAGTQGIHSLFVVAHTPNNPIGAYFNTENEVATRVGEGVGSELKMLDYGNGFHPRTCDYTSGSTAVHDGVCTPGQVIAETLANWTESPLTMGEAADEVAETWDSGMLNLQLKILNEELIK